MKAKTRNKYGIFQDCLRGDVQSAINAARAKVRELSSRDARDFERLQARFADGIDRVPIRTKDPVARRLVEIHRTYYQAVLMKRASADEAGAALCAHMKDVLSSSGVQVDQSASIDSLEQPLKALLRGRGFFSLLGRIQPFYSLSLWTKQSQRKHVISLPEKTATIRVNYVDEVLEHGWMSYATLGRFYSGGWVPDDTPGEIFCVTKAYRRRPEALRVNLLAHEAQHVVDLAAYPKLEPTDLEYRAKLVELSLSPRPGILLDKFRTQAIKDRNHPHGFASFHISQRVRARKPEDLRRQVLSLLTEHSEKMRCAADAGDLRTVLP